MKDSDRNIVIGISIIAGIIVVSLMIFSTTAPREYTIGTVHRNMQYRTFYETQDLIYYEWEDSNFRFRHNGLRRGITQVCVQIIPNPYQPIDIYPRNQPLFQKVVESWRCGL